MSRIRSPDPRELIPSYGIWTGLAGLWSPWPALWGTQHSECHQCGNGDSTPLSLSNGDLLRVIAFARTDEASANGLGRPTADAGGVIQPTLPPMHKLLTRRNHGRSAISL